MVAISQQYYQHLFPNGKVIKYQEVNLAEKKFAKAFVN